MKDHSLVFLTEEARGFHKEFTQCQNMEDIMELTKKMKKLNESCKNNEIPHLDMTLEEFRTKFNTISHKELMQKYGF